MSDDLSSGSSFGKWGRCEQLVFRTACRRVFCCDVSLGSLFGKSVGRTVDKHSWPIDDASTLDISSTLSGWKRSGGTPHTPASLWVSRVAAAAVKSETLRRTNGPRKERHHQTLSVASSRVSLGCLFGKSVDGILDRKNFSE